MPDHEPAVNTTVQKLIGANCQTITIITNESVILKLMRESRASGIKSARLCPGRERENWTHANHNAVCHGECDIRVASINRGPNCTGPTAVLHCEAVRHNSKFSERTHDPRVEHTPPGRVVFLRLSFCSSSSTICTVKSHRPLIEAHLCSSANFYGVPCSGLSRRHGPPKATCLRLISQWPLLIFYYVPKLRP